MCLFMAVYINVYISSSRQLTGDMVDDEKHASKFAPYSGSVILSQIAIIVYVMILLTAQMMMMIVDADVKCYTCGFGVLCWRVSVFQKKFVVSPQRTPKVLFHLGIYCVIVMLFLTDACSSSSVGCARVR